MTYGEFINSYNGRSVDFDSAYGPQCVDLILFYLRDVYGFTGFGGNAKDWYYNYGGNLAARFDRVTNNPNDYNQVPKRGDIIIWNGGLAGSGGYGHIAIFDKVNGPGSFTSFDQNWGGQYAHFVTHNWNNVAGWLTPKATTSTGGDKPMTPQEEANAYQIVLNRAMEHGGSGRTGYKFITDAKAEVDAQRAAIRQQIDSLNKTINQLNVKVTELTSNDATDAAAIKAGLDEIGRLTGELEAAHDKIKELENSPEVVYTQDQETKDNVNKILALVQSIFDYFKGQYKSFSKYIKKD